MADSDEGLTGWRAKVASALAAAESGALYDPAPPSSLPADAAAWCELCGRPVFGGASVHPCCGRGDPAVPCEGCAASSAFWRSRGHVIQRDSRTR